MSEQDAILEAREIEFSYGNGRPVLNGVSLSLFREEFLTVCGPNGSGKSTLLAALLGHIRPLKGEILFEGRPSPDCTELSKKISFLEQDMRPDVPLTVEEYVCLGRFPHRKKFAWRPSKEDLKIVEETMELIGISELRGRDFRTLSGGQRRLAGIARAMSSCPRAVILDEPTSGLDIDNQARVIRVISSLKSDSGLSVLAVLHDLTQAAIVSDRVCLFHRGRVIATGEPASVLTRENLSRVYGGEFLVDNAILSGAPVYASMARSTKKRKTKIHLICGGGSGGALMADLLKAGFEVSVGVLNKGDTDHRIATLLGLEKVEEEAFAGVSPAAFETLCRLLERADVIIISSVPFGNGNLANLVAVAEECKRRPHKRVIMVREKSGWQDFTGGRAAAIIEALKAAGAEVVDGKPEDLLSSLD